ncbi:hypothetical protein CAPTEDRAFT_219867 [Capitella teleta]|uniref:ubiquitinyl hydrolase 1 n=1 Tax=Capitella teleta TaxID=283909 RepID=R7UCV4_CAPTE|nr:hypothetical protein CAPTEDRAFT_219867 [Capitella teleta]|eukprot:ELU04220.1 hypothetical protein CAPTEDRAFT_219867 [Capitella teleta]
MCDVCGGVLTLLAQHDTRIGEGEGLHLSKAEVLSIVKYIQVWQQRQCMCCFKEFKNFERMNNLTQVVLHRAIKLIADVIQNDESEKVEKTSTKEEIKEKVDENDLKKDKEKEEEKNEKESEEVKEEEKEEKEEKKESKEEKDEEDGEKKSKRRRLTLEEEEENEIWTIEEKDCLFHIVTKIFMLNLPLYLSYKHYMLANLEELSQQEFSALNNYCELSDPDIPVYLLRNVCFFCDSNGLQTIARCFDKATPDTLPCSVAHTLINIVANLRLWMNTSAVIQMVSQVRGHMIHYMCQLSDQELRIAASHNMMDLLWTAVKEPLESHMSFDEEGLKLAFKYFTCSTLTIRLTGVSQINNQISLYNDLASNESLVETERWVSGSIGNQLADWLTKHKIIEHIFGPNLHVEIIKQCQIILTLLASEGRITNEHINIMWAAGQLKHCGKLVQDTLLSLIKSLEISPAKHLLQLVSHLDAGQHSEQTLLLASAVIKFLWARAAHQNHPSTAMGASCVHHHLSPVQSSEKLLVADFSSSGHSESDASGIDLEEGEIKPHLVAELDTRINIPGGVKIKHGGRVIVTADTDDEDEDEEDMSNISEASLPSHSSEEELLQEATLDPSEEVALLHTLKAVASNSSEGEGLSSEERAYLRYATKPGMAEELDSYLQHINSSGGQHPTIPNALIEDLMSGEEASCNSSHLSNKSEKNMADFEGEDVMSEEEELARINAAGVGRTPSHYPRVGSTGRGGRHLMQQHLATMASLYHKHIPKAVVKPKVQSQESMLAGGQVKFEEVCERGNTLLWDLLQDHTIHLLPDGLVEEAEKVLCTLVCYSTDAVIRTKFIEACVENIANHRSVVISLRLLPKIFSSFHQFRSGLDTHSVTHWAEQELHMMQHFFNDLIYHTAAVKRGVKTSPSLYPNRKEIQARLQFLTCVFTNAISADSFRLTLDQVDTLWSCLVMQAEFPDDALSWFLNQAKSKDHHALGINTYKHVFKHRMCQLKPEAISMIGLNLFTNLCHLARIANASLDKPLPDDQINGMEQLWDIALKAQNTDVSLNAIHYLNNHYINSDGANLVEREDEFINHCMDSLYEAVTSLDKSPESSLLVIQRGLILLTNHLESFRKRHAFHLRMWQLEGDGITSHQKSLQDSQSCALRVMLQPAGASDKTTLEMLSSDLVAELRAEVTNWWEGVQQRHQQKQEEAQQASSVAGSVLTPILGAMLGDGPIRMITQGQELTTDMDEKSLSDLQFKDGQVVFVSLGSNRQPRKQDPPPSYLPAPAREKLPMMLLLGHPHFDRLFSLLSQLTTLKPLLDRDAEEQYSLQSKAQVLSRKVWNLLMVLPTNPKILQGFKDIDSRDEGDACVNWHDLLDTHNPHKLMYSLQVVESLSRPPKHRRHSMFQSKSSRASLDDRVDDVTLELPEEAWSRQFLQRCGVKHLFEIFLAGSLHNEAECISNEWIQDCLAYLLRLLSQFAVTIPSSRSCATLSDNVFVAETAEPPRKKTKKQRAQEKLIVPRLNQTVLSMIEVDSVVKLLMNILSNAAQPRQEHSGWSLGYSGRVEVVHYAMSFLVSMAFTCEDQAQPAVCNSEDYSGWLRRLTLETPEPELRQEACQGLYRLCLGRSADGQTGYSFLMSTLANLLTSLPKALALEKPVKRCQEDKEAFGPGCRDYFWLVCRLVEGVSAQDARNSWTQENSLVDLNALAKQVAQNIVNRPYLERRHSGGEEDDGLIGLLTMSIAIARHNPPFKTSTEGQTFLVEIFWCLFALASPKQRYLPKCKSATARSLAFDLMVEMVLGSVTNYSVLHEKVIRQHCKESHVPYTWDNWPHEEERSHCGYVGLTNLGATCYMATCMQHLYMIPEARRSVLEAQCSGDNQHKGTLQELKKMFAYLSESERKAYNPRNFCKVYTMDHQPLNTGEQKDMTEFFTDLISKMEEMGPQLKKLVKNLFGGNLTNNVVSLDCNHVSRTKEEFYTVRCQVADMKNLYESLDEVTVKDMLEGDNMYTCSKCQKKVRAEKRACFKKLPKILCFNTMRYTFNMVTMMKEKVNTHFSFPLRLDMAAYMEDSLIHKDRLQEDENEEEAEGEDQEMEYELIGVTVHTGTADGGHYYSFIRDRIHKQPEISQDKWFLFNDAEVKPFDPAQIASECFGGEMTSKTYDSVTDKFMDFSFEKTNSAYMLFYERIEKSRGGTQEEPSCSSSKESSDGRPSPTHDQQKFEIELSEELAEWIWQDNMQFLQDKNIFEHTYFGFMWQMCGYIPSSLAKESDSKLVPLMAAKLTASFVLETLIHAKEKPTMLQWIELLTKQFNACPAACQWFLDAMAKEDWWPQQILIKCPNQTVRQMFQRLVIHVINQLRPSHSQWYIYPLIDSSDEEEEEVESIPIGSKSCVTRFIRKMLSIIEHGPRPHCKYLGEFFSFLYEFAKMGENEQVFLLQVKAITIMISFFMAHKNQHGYVEILSDDEEAEGEVIAPQEDKYRPQSLEKMIALIAMLVESSRGQDKQLHLSQSDYQAIIGSNKGFPFLYNQILDSINLRHTCNLIFSLTRWNDRLAIAITQMIFGAITRLGADSQPFFKMLSMLVEFMGGPPGMPSFTHYILQKFWEVAEYCPKQCLDWLCSQVTRNKVAHTWTLQNLEVWVETFLLAHSNIRVRNAAAYLLVALVPSNHFRQIFCMTRNILSPMKEGVHQMNQEAVDILHEVYGHLLSLLSHAWQYADPQVHGTSKLVQYFSIMQHCLISRPEKIMALLHFWYQACVDCPDNVKMIVSNALITKNIAFNYILADHEDQEVITFNRQMLPAYYGILRMCCQQSRAFTRQLAQHQNMQWAFKNISTYPTQYAAAVEELFSLMRLMVEQHADMTEEELRAVSLFRRNTMQLYLHNVDARMGWQSLVTALGILVESKEDKLMVLQSNGLSLLHEAFNTLYVMHHEATACHVTADIIELLGLVSSVLKVARHCNNEKKGAEAKPHLANWTEKTEFSRKLLTLLNSYTPSEMRAAAIETLREQVLTFQGECLQAIVTFLVQAHTSFQDNNVPITMGPYFPKRGQRALPPKSNVRPIRPQFQMFLHSNQLESTKGVDETYDQALQDFYCPYHLFIDLLVRVSVNNQNVTEALVHLSAMVAFEGVPLHIPLFAKLWYEIYQSEQVDKSCIKWLCNSSIFIEYVDATLLYERHSLNNHHIYQFFCNFFPKVYQQVLSDQGQSLIDSLLSSIKANKEASENSTANSRNLNKLWSNINGDLRALMLIFSVQQPKQPPQSLTDGILYFQQRAVAVSAANAAAAAAKKDRDSPTADEENPAKRQRTSSESSNAEISEAAAVASPSEKKDCVMEEEPQPSCSTATEEKKEEEEEEVEEDDEEEPCTSTQKPRKVRSPSSCKASSTTLIDLVLKNCEHILQMIGKSD